MVDCPIVVTNNGLTDNDPCGGGFCWPWYVQSWQEAAKRELEIATRLQNLMGSDARQALANASVELTSLLEKTGLNLVAIWNASQYQTILRQLATVAKALRCLWFEAAQKQKGDPPPMVEVPPSASTQEKKEAQQSWWSRWLPDLSQWAPKLSWPSLPGVDVPLQMILDKLKSWFWKILPWVIGGVVLYFGAPLIAKKMAMSRIKRRKR